ncbi:hypothetical protein FMEAI12_5080012 [Parafrankia sp. Ea1.12]|nr:hypothetical protein FMEAI12_5080012 [Parafrankia sp. Ea1.12]
MVSRGSPARGVTVALGGGDQASVRVSFDTCELTESEMPNASSDLQVANAWDIAPRTTGATNLRLGDSRQVRTITADERGAGPPAPAARSAPGRA